MLQYSKAAHGSRGGAFHSTSECLLLVLSGLGFKEFYLDPAVASALIKLAVLLVQKNIRVVGQGT